MVKIKEASQSQIEQAITIESSADSSETECDDLLGTILEAPSN